MFRKFLRFGVLGFFVASTHAVGAQPIDQCMRGRDSNNRLAACNAVLADPKASAETRWKAYRQRGNLRAEAGRHNEAIEDFSQVIKVRPGDARAYAQRGLAHLVTGRKALALQDLTRAVDLAPRADEYLLARGYLHLTENRLKEAIADFDAALERRPDNAVALNNRGLAYRKLGELGKAIADYTASIARNPSYALAYANRGYAFEAKGEKDKAIDDFRAALLIDRTLQGATKALGRLGIADAQDKAMLFVEEGRVIVRVLCSGCHAVGADDTSPNENAPALRTLVDRYPLLSLREPLSRGIAAPHAEMPRFKIAGPDVDRIVAYLNSLRAGK